jgi:hypothetical protein
MWRPTRTRISESEFRPPPISDSGILFTLTRIRESGMSRRSFPRTRNIPDSAIRVRASGESGQADPNSGIHG